MLMTELMKFSVYLCFVLESVLVSAKRDNNVGD